jgi:hypothetical protein
VKKQDPYFAKLEEYREHFRTQSSDFLRQQLPQMSIKVAAVAASDVLKERGEPACSFGSGDNDLPDQEGQSRAQSL